MKLSRYFHVPILLVALELLSGQKQVHAAPPRSIVPSSILRGDEAVRYLWDEVQTKTLFRWLPAEYHHVEPAWWDFLHTEAVPIIDTYYYSTFKDANFLELTKPERDAAFYTDRHWMGHRKIVAERLVKAFAEKQLAERIAARAPPIEVQSSLRSPVKQQGKSLSSGSELPAQRHEWGQWLGLGS
ncbi:hypothetical protein PSEUBRA_005345 [Kalmanozyma brasiliensis GHG001]|uniref:uncharacterized protein n=1 Tax=Kalmanozyma brasiliensis (strain GHG001) TaxID=1365824 RepID=UPI00286832CB|nr:uncharacterized protein PSEUBRA_005345 [Kalmanozyma brasiliensis GHG001]KAF6767515.1 hypothetical protein PSEUBRA_005345 [Kalmanozyma brasiliensis GHG001]